MSRPSAFDQMFCEPITFWDGQQVLDGRVSRSAAIQMFIDEYGAFLLDDRYARHHVDSNLGWGWVKFHAGHNEDGEPCNAWWLYDKPKVPATGYKAVYVYWPDRHYAMHGHMYHPQINEQGYRVTNDECDICKKLKEEHLNDPNH